MANDIKAAKVSRFSYCQERTALIVLFSFVLVPGVLCSDSTRFKNRFRRSDPSRP
jgi:hypothetical protein